MQKLETATLAGGCFWCTEAIFKRIRGVKSVVSGYAGGEMDNPAYDDVTTGTTGHAETIQITFDPKTISYEKLLEVFFKLHDPTTLNHQGADLGTQYRSSIFYHDDKQKETAQKVRVEIEKSGIYKDKILTEIVPYENFYKAEDDHQNFYDKNPAYSYCQIVIDPKIQKLYKLFPKFAKNQKSLRESEGQT